MSDSAEAEGQLRPAEINGRQRAREEARSRILEAARSAFAEKGFAATSVVGIAERAGCTKGLVHHYFGSKRELWIEVIEDFAREGIEREATAGEAGDDLEAILTRMRGSFRYFQRTGDYLRIARWAELEAGDGLPESMQKLMHRHTDQLRRAQGQGELRGDLDPLHVHAMTYLMMTGWFQTKRFFCPAWGRDAEAASVDDRYLEDMIEFVRAGVEAVAEKKRREGRG